MPSGTQSETLLRPRCLARQPPEKLNADSPAGPGTGPHSNTDPALSYPHNLRSNDSTQARRTPPPMSFLRTHCSEHPRWATRNGPTHGTAQLSSRIRLFRSFRRRLRQSRPRRTTRRTQTSHRPYGPFTVVPFAFSRWSTSAFAIAFSSRSLPDPMSASSSATRPAVRSPIRTWLQEAPQSNNP